MDCSTASRASDPTRLTTGASSASKLSTEVVHVDPSELSKLEKLPTEIFLAIVEKLSFADDTFLNFMLTNKNIFKFTRQHEHQICQRIVAERYPFTRHLLLVEEEVHDDYSFDHISKLSLQVEEARDIMSRIYSLLPDGFTTGLANEKTLLFAGLFIIRRSWSNRITYGSVAMEEVHWMATRTSKLEIWLCIRFANIIIMQCWKHLLASQPVVNELWDMDKHIDFRTSFVIENTIRRRGFDRLRTFLIDDRQLASDPTNVEVIITEASEALKREQSYYYNENNSVVDPENYRALRIRLIDDLIPMLHDREKRRKEYYSKLPASEVLTKFYERNSKHTDFSPFNKYMADTAVAGGFDEEQLEKLINWEETTNTETVHLDSIWKDRRDVMTLDSITKVYAELDVCVRNGWGVFNHSRSRYLADARFI